MGSRNNHRDMLLPVVLVTFTLAGGFCQEWTPLAGGRNPLSGSSIPLAGARTPLAGGSIPLAGVSIPPPSLAGDTLVNKLLSEKRRTGGLRQVDRNTELVAEHPPGSGRVYPIKPVLPTKPGSEFTPSTYHNDVVNDLTREIVEENANLIPGAEKVEYQQNKFKLKPRLSWARPRPQYRDI